MSKLTLQFSISVEILKKKTHQKILQARTKLRTDQKNLAQCIKMSMSGIVLNKKLKEWQV